MGSTRGIVLKSIDAASTKNLKVLVIMVKLRKFKIIFESIGWEFESQENKSVLKKYLCCQNCSYWVPPEGKC